MMNKKERNLSCAVAVVSTCLYDLRHLNQCIFM